MPDTEQYLIDAADRCKQLARLSRELSQELESMHDEFMAKAVEIDTARQKRAARRG